MVVYVCTGDNPLVKARELSSRTYAQTIQQLTLKETKSATLNIFRNFYSFQIIRKSRIKLRFHNKYVHYS